MKLYMVEDVGHKCFREEVGDKKLIELKMVQVTSEKIKIIKNRMKVTLDR